MSLRLGREHPIVLAVVIAAAGAAGGLIGGSFAEGKLQELLFGAAITLVFAGLLGGIISLLLDNARKLQERRREQARFVQAVLDDLKDAHDRVERVSVKVNAQRSLPAYAKAMDALLDAKIVLRNVERALENSPDPGEWRTQCVGYVKSMREYVAGIVGEYEKHYADLAATYRRDAADADAQVAALDQFSDLRTEHRPRYHTEFGDPLVEATLILRLQLRRLTGGP